MRKQASLLEIVVRSLSKRIEKPIMGLIDLMLLLYFTKEYGVEITISLWLLINVLSWTWNYYYPEDFGDK
ncbi:hypothetical protein H6G33_09980 [Calothrix sp. FACHB-1219]|uniref:hypothetical protein n=1 Tax=unclassified Calothrix TaxID=2619626 RepID=UPI001685094C|nr:MULTISPECIES: hypothetical protein [unclassified Calothrix]MBD2201675.1 hypothetical protein [Calothrix sp. FACHB-168]MBD2217361.1 hypothetical protein [Calothrix sp. FACHB-1219]